MIAHAKKRLLYGLLILLCAGLCVIGMGAYKWRRNREATYAQYYINAARNMRDAAEAHGSLEEPCKSLYLLQDGPFSAFTPVPIGPSLARLLAQERKRDAEDLITFLRAKTGNDLGSQPGPWILRYGGPSFKALEENLERLEQEHVSTNIKQNLTRQP